MAKLVWDTVGERLYETGVSNVALFVVSDTKTGTYGNGVAWNGVTSIEESPSGAEANALYADNTKYLNLYSVEEFAASINAYMYPDEFAACNGEAALLSGAMLIGQQSRKKFGLVYKTKIGSDTDDSFGYKLHILYGLKAGVTSRTHSTVNDSPEAEEMSWELSATPITATVNGVDYTNIYTIVVDSTAADTTKLKALEDIIYGTESAEPKLPLPAEVYAALNA